MAAVSQGGGMLVDSSAWARIGRIQVRTVVAQLLDAGRAWTCAVVELEAGVSAQSVSDHDGVRTRFGLLQRAVMTETVTNRALAVQRTLVERGEHRGVGLPDLLVASCAAQAGVTVLHYDHDFDLIADVTGQPTQWVVPRGSVA